MLKLSSSKGMVYMKRLFKKRCCCRRTTTIRCTQGKNPSIFNLVFTEFSKASNFPVLESKLFFKHLLFFLFVICDLNVRKKWDFCLLCTARWPQFIPWEKCQEQTNIFFFPSLCSTHLFKAQTHQSHHSTRLHSG